MSSSQDINDYDVDAKEYSKIDLRGQGTLFLSFRDIQGLIQKYLKVDKSWEDCKCLDYGCGAGRSTRFLKSIGFSNVDGFDISQTMLKEAKKMDPSGHYSLIQSAKIPASNNTYDLALASFVFVEMGDKNAIEEIFKEIYRVLKPQGLFMIVTTSPELYHSGNQWLSYKISNENGSLESGEAISLKMTDINLDIFDYLWKEEDYKTWSRDSAMHLLAKESPKGKPSDDIAWKSEAKVSPYALYVLQK